MIELANDTHPHTPYPKVLNYFHPSSNHKPHIRLQKFSPKKIQYRQLLLPSISHGSRISTPVSLRLAVYSLLLSSVFINCLIRSPDSPPSLSASSIVKIISGLLNRSRPLSKSPSNLGDITTKDSSLSDLSPSSYCSSVVLVRMAFSRRMCRMNECSAPGDVESLAD